MSKVLTIAFAAVLAGAGWLAAVDHASAQGRPGGARGGGGGGPAMRGGGGGGPPAFRGGGGGGPRFGGGGGPRFGGGAPPGIARGGFAGGGGPAVAPRFAQPRFAPRPQFAPQVRPQFAGGGGRYARPIYRPGVPPIYRRPVHRPRFAPIYRPRYVAPFYPVVNSCYRWRRIWTAYGPRWRRVNVCYRPPVRIRRPYIPYYYY